ncbi:hypothetical protein BTURTLESOX_850 [bacterium endosymbiont of Bathymodiolus sp. 5 South]|nr:hypothetical protein BTURTLESOX_850 [bacterium endosymbiont of Bathymodiolus sp. 5 South]
MSNVAILSSLVFFCMVRSSVLFTLPLLTKVSTEKVASTANILPSSALLILSAVTPNVMASMYPLLFSAVAVTSSVSLIKIRAPLLLFNVVFILSVAFLAEMSFWLSSVLAEIINSSFENNNPWLFTARLLMVNWLLAEICALSALFSVLPIVSVVFLAAIFFLLLSVLAAILSPSFENNKPLLLTVNN